MTERNTKDFVVLGTLSMFYIMLVLCSAMLTNKVVAFGPAVTLAGVLIVPFIFSTADIMAELYGYKIASLLIQIAFIVQLTFALICIFCIKLHSPSFWHGYEEYHYVFSSLMRMSLASFVSYILSSTINVYLISKWKILWKGRFFWIRSIGSSTSGELIYTIMIILLMQYHKFPAETLTDMIITSYSIKIACSALFSLPANIIVNILKKYLVHKPSHDNIIPFARKI